MDVYLVRHLFGIEWLNIRWYSFIICIGICAGIAVGLLLAKKRGYSSDLPLDLVLVCIPLAFLFARIYYVAFSWEYYKDDLLSIFAVWEGGIAFYGGFSGAVFGAWLFSRRNKIPFGDILDVGAPALILGQAIGRWGNFINQEAYGNLITNTSLKWFPYGVYIDNLGEWHQATFFYESIWNLLVFFALLWYFKRARRKGNVFVLYLVLYGAGRAYIEGLRTDSLWLIDGVIRVSQLLSVLFILFGVAYLLYMHSKPVRAPAYTGKYARKRPADAVPSEEAPAPAGAEAQPESPRAEGKAPPADADKDDGQA